MFSPSQSKFLRNFSTANKIYENIPEYVGSKVLLIVKLPSGREEEDDRGHDVEELNE